MYILRCVEYTCITCTCIYGSNVFPFLCLLKNCTILGALLTYITVTGQKWSQLMDAYMHDLMDRNARRVIKAFPELNTTEASETYV